MKDCKQKEILQNKKMMKYIMECYKQHIPFTQIAKRIKIEFGMDVSDITIGRIIKKTSNIQPRIGDKMRELLQPQVTQKLLQWEIDSISKLNMRKLLMDEFNISVSLPTLYDFFTRVKIQNINNKEQENKNAYDILYENRHEVVKMKNERYANFVIAEKFGVKLVDVEDFFNKRKVITSEQHKDIRRRAMLGETAKAIADYYGIAEKSVQAILDKAGVLTTSSRVLAKVKEETEIQKVEELNEFNPLIIKQFTKFINTLQYKYDTAVEQLKKFDDIRNDIYHILELGEQDENEQLELLAKIKNSSIERRQYKDFMILVEPLIEFLQNADNKRVLATLGNIAGRICNNAEKMESRVYFLREDK